MHWLRLDPPIPVTTPDGTGMAYFIRDYGVDHDDMWTVCLDSGNKANQFWTYRNSEIRAVTNISFGRTS